MTSGRVLATETARTSIERMRATIDGPLATDIDSIIRDGDVLSQPDVWDGPLAHSFRHAWPTTARQLRHAREELQRLNGEVDRIRANIMVAGGHAG